MVTGYEVHMYNHIELIARNLNRIANVLEAQEKRAREKPVIDPDSLGAVALWKEEVADGTCTIGFTDWMAWHTADNPLEQANALIQGTTPEEIERAGEAIQAVKRGFDEMERQVKGEGADG